MCASSRMYTRRAPPMGDERHVLSQLTDVVHGVVGRRVHLHDVERAADHDRPAGRIVGREVGARTALGVERAGQQLGHAGLARAARAHEQIGVVDLAQLDRVAQGAHDALLADDLVEGLRAVATVEGEHRRPMLAVPRTWARAARAGASKGGPCTRRRGLSSGVPAGLRLKSGWSAAHERVRLRLLPSGSDLVRSRSPRGTRPSTPRSGVLTPKDTAPRTGIRPR